MDNDLIIERIKKAMDDNKVNAAELSRRTGLAESTISRYMAGKTYPKQNAIGAIAEALHVNPAWLLGYEVSGGSYDFLAHIEQLDDSDKENVKRYIEFLIEKQNNKS